MYYTVCLFFLLNIFFSSASFQLTYTSNITLSPDYILHWKVGDDNLNIGLKVRTTGWIGFGIGEYTSGSMPGADFVVVENENSNPIVTDRYSEYYDEPLIDDCQNWVIKSYNQQEDGFTTVELERPLLTYDTKDRNITAGDTKILWAYGENEQNKIIYHSHKGINQVAFIPSSDSIPPLNAEYSLTLTMDHLQVPEQKTSYMCFATPIQLPDPTKDYHVIQVDPVVQPENIDIVHHFVVFLCKNDSSTTYYTNASLCSTGPGLRSCPGMLYGWGVGGNSLYFPEEAGYRIGAGSTGNYLILQVHYNNPQHNKGRIDSSGIRIHYTDKLRKYDSGSLILGNVDIREATIPANTSYYRVEASCPSVCTSMWPHNITVFGDFLHMHNTGSMIWSTLHRNNTRVPGYFNRIEYWDFAFQGFIGVKKVIAPGDRINVVCIYNTTNKNATKFGEGSDEEMCIEYLAYYPKLIIDGEDMSLTCGSSFGRYYYPNSTTRISAMSPDTRNYSTKCWKKSPLDSNNITLVNPDIPDMNQEDTLRAFQRTNTYPCPTNNSEMSYYVHIILGTAAGFLVVGLIYAVSQLNRNLKKTSAYEKVPIQDELDRF